MSELPSSWATTPLLAVCELLRGVTYTKDVAASLPGPDRLPVLRANNLQGRAFDLSDLVYVPSDLVSQQQRILAGDVVVATSSGSISVVGKAVQSQCDMAAGFGAFCGVLRPAQALNSRYFGHFFSSEAYRTRVSALARGSNINNLKREHFESLLFPVAPPDEQQRIADKLDTVLARVDACRGRLARVAPLLKRFRQSVLAAATSGRLTEDWRRIQGVVETGAGLLSVLQEDHARAGGHARGNASEPTEEAHDLDSSSLPTTWAIATMLDVCEPGRPITYGILKPGPELDEGVPYVRVADFPGNRLRLDSIKKTSLEIDEQFRRARLRPGDLLLSIRGSVGRVVEIPEELAGANITQDTARLSINARVNRRYVLFAILNEGTQRRMRAATRGVAVRGINIGDVRALQVPLPPATEQAEIVRRVETLFAFADRLEARLAQAQTAVDRLTPSLLAKAFRGELVPQDPADEPAVELLKRLSAGTTDRPAPRRGRRGAPVQA